MVNRIFSMSPQGGAGARFPRTWCPLMLRPLVSALVLTAPAVLAGCAVPPAVTAVSVALDGVSYLSSGRSVTDHALSVVAAQDCMLLRLVEGEWVCRDFVEGEETYWVAESKHWADGPEVVGLVAVDGAQDIETPTRPDTGHAEIKVAALDTVETLSDASPLGPSASSMMTPDPSTTARRTAPRGNARIMLVLGSFKNPENARKLARRLADIGARVSRATLNGEVFHRVVIRPIGSAGVKAARRRLHERGMTSVWATRAPVAG